MSAGLIVVVDDERDLRPSIIPSGSIVKVLRTSGEAIDFIESAASAHTDIAQIWLDHDLGGDDTIMPFVRKIEELHQEGTLPPVGQFVVHTSNPVGGSQMMKILENVGNTVRVYAGTYLEVQR